MVIVSIIIPIYNAELYLASAIRSVLNQTYRYWELLLIDDGSTDNSLLIAEEFNVLEDRIRVISKLNSGVSETRNLGLLHSYGKYVIFMDADDYWCDSSFLEEFVSLAECKNLDIVRGEYKAITVDGEELFKNTIGQLKASSENIVLDSYSFLDNVIQREFFLPLCLLKRDTIQGVIFNAERVFLEDVEFMIQVLLKPLRCYYKSVCFYAYRKHDSSASNNYTCKRLSDAFDISRMYLNLSLSGIDDRLANSFKRRSWDYYWLTLRTMARVKHLFNESRELCKELKLNNLKKDLLHVIKDVESNNRWMRFISPYMLICYFRLRYILGKLYRKCFNI